MKGADYKKEKGRRKKWYSSFLIPHFLIIMLFFSSCSDFLGILPLNEIVLENYWTSEDDVRAMVSACYSRMATNDFVKHAFVWGEFRSDNIVRGLGTSNEEIEILEGNLQPSHSVTHWGAYYDVINLCNTTLHYAPDVLGRDPDFGETEWLALRSEVLAIRALCYFYLVRTFRDVPLVVTPTIDDNTSYQQAAADPDDVLRQIVDDLQEAERYAVRRFAKDDYNRGRITLAAVQAILADVYLWMQQYDDCITYCNKVIASKIDEAERAGMRYDGSWPLIGNQKENATAEAHEAYNRIFGEGNSFESIFEIQFRESQQYNSIIPGYYGRATSPVGAVSAASFICDGATSGNELFTKNDLRAVENFNAKSTSFYPIQKYVVRSFDNQDRPTYITVETTNWIFYRLTDVMLMEAEALVQRRDGDEYDMRDAFSLVTSVYNRANIGQAAKDTLTFSTYNSKAKMESLVLEERQRELMFEGKRWFDLVRKARREGTNSAMLDLAKRKYTYPDAVKSKWIKPDMLYFPINEDELKKNLLLTQNPGYDMGETIKKNE